MERDSLIFELDQCISFHCNNIRYLMFIIRIIYQLVSVIIVAEPLGLLGFHAASHILIGTVM